MFDYVNKKEFDAEHELRVKAEAAAALAREAEQRALAMLESERAAHRQELADVLDRFAPKPKDPVPGFGVPGRGPTYEEIMHVPAVGKRGLRERNAAALEAKAREEAESKEDQAAGQRAVLNPQEAELLDSQIPA